MSKIREMRENTTIDEDSSRNTNLELDDKLEVEKFDIWDRFWGGQRVLGVELTC